MRAPWLIAAVLLLTVVSVAYWAGRGAKEPETRAYGPVNEVLGGAPAQGFLRADHPRRFHFPEDHRAHPGFRNEWWYFTGNLKSADGRSFGYQLTFFRVALNPRPIERPSRWVASEIYMAHFALTDIDGRRYRYAERFSRGAMGLAGAGGDPFAVRLEEWSAVETSPKPWRMKLTAADAGMAIDLEVTAVKPEVLNGAGGLSQKSGTPGNASYYYSIPRMKTTGTVRSGNESFSVTGSSWLDREWSTSALERGQVGWDWFALQLDDGRDVMFYRIRRQDGSTDPYSAGTLIAASGAATPLRPDEVQLEISRWWKSPASGARYPSLWRLRIPSQRIDIDIAPRLISQELLTSFRYWEGAVEMQDRSGKRIGSGYLEMTGY